MKSYSDNSSGVSMNGMRTDDAVDNCISQVDLDLSSFLDLTTILYSDLCFSDKGTESQRGQALCLLSPASLRWNGE